MGIFTIEELENVMKNVGQVRNFTIAAQVDAGKSTFSDSMLSYAGLIKKDLAGDKVEMDTMKIEQERGITIKSVGVSMLFEHMSKSYVMNMIDSPGHIDFSAEVSAAVRVSDGVFVLLDPIDGVMAQTKTVLIQSLEERVKPVLLINKIDKLFLSLKMKPMEIYNQLVKNVYDVNDVISTYQDNELIKITGPQVVDPTKGNVMFGSAYHTWGFTLKTFAKMYSEKLNKPVDSLMNMLWKPDNFCKYIIEPIYAVINACVYHPDPIPGDEKKTTLVDLLKKLNIQLKPIDLEARGKELMRKVMGSWLPIAPTAVEMAVDHLPSPNIAQKYRAELLYKGPHTEEDIYFNSIKNCDPQGPLIIYISKMVPTKDNSHFYAFGRVFSGTVKSGRINVLMNEHNPLVPKEHGHHKTFLKDTIQRVLLMMASKIETIETVAAGNIMALDGVDKTMVKSGTIVGENDLQCFPLKNMAFSVSPIVKYSLKPKDLGDLAKFTETLKKFVKSDPCLQYIMTDEGEHVLAGAGELHLEVAIQHLKDDFLKNIEFTVSEPIVPYCETVTVESEVMCLSKSPNKHNRLFCKAKPLDHELVEDMEFGSLPKDPKELVKFLFNEYEIDIPDAKKIWSLAPENEPINIMIDRTSGIQYLNEIKDSCRTAFIHSSEKGPLCDEPIRGIQLDIHDVVLHADAIHRGGGQIIPTTRNVVYASMLAAKPRLMEPIFKVEIHLPRDKVNSIYGLMTKRRGNVNNINEESTGNMVRVEGDLPVADSFGFVEDLRGVTSGTAFASMCFSHWQLVDGDPLVEGTYANKIVKAIRKRKGLKEELPKFEDYNDKL